jgi:tetratricopeptide (TPR) repeat protein
LQQSLAARLDRLGQARETAQIGAVLGRDFGYSLLRDVAGHEESGLQAALERLAEAGILFVEGIIPLASYRFKHALIQDAAYDSLLKSRRQALHRRVAELMRDAPEHVGAAPEIIARHFTEAGLNDLAIEWWGKAGDEALRRSAFQEAIAHLGKAIAMADAAGDTGQRWLHLQVAYGNALIAARGYGAPETTEAFAKARQTAAGAANAPELPAIDYGLWVGSYVRGELPSMRAHSAAFLRDVSSRPASPEASVAHRTAGVTHIFAGEYRNAQEHLERALALFQPGRDDDLTFRFGHDAGVAVMVYLAIALWPIGDVARSITLVERAERRIESIPHVGTRAFGKMHAVMFDLMRGDHARALSNVPELARVADEYNLKLWSAFGAFLRGWAASEGNAPADGLEDMRAGAKSLCELNVVFFDGLLKIALAKIEARAGDFNRALSP